MNITHISWWHYIPYFTWVDTVMMMIIIIITIIIIIVVINHHNHSSSFIIHHHHHHHKHDDKKRYDDHDHDHDDDHDDDDNYDWKCGAMSGLDGTVKTKNRSECHGPNAQFERCAHLNDFSWNLWLFSVLSALEMLKLAKLGLNIASCTVQKDINNCH